MGGDYAVSRWPSAAASSSQTRVHLRLAHRREERQRQRVGRGGFGDRELALAVAELAQVREEVDAGQVGLAGDAALGQAGDRRVAVDAGGEPDGVDEPAAALLAAAGDRRRARPRARPGRSRVERGDGARARASSASSFSTWATPSAAARSERR